MLKFGSIVFLILLANCTSSEKTEAVDPANPSETKISRVEEAKKEREVQDVLAKELKSSPFPEKPSYYVVKNFMTKYKTAYAQYEPLVKEYQAYFKTLNISRDLPENESAALRQRVIENPLKAHWTYLQGVVELMEYLQEGSGKVLQSDKEANFVARMKVLTFLSTQLSQISKDKKYSTFTRSVYIALSENHFGRILFIPGEKK